VIIKDVKCLGSWYLEGGRRRSHGLMLTVKDSSVELLFSVMMFVGRKPESVCCRYS